jgi:hypothetical protein
MRRPLCLSLFCLGLISVSRAQDFKLWNRTIQVHGFLSEGYVHTDENNWLTMNTKGWGSAAMTDTGLNVSSQLADRLRVGAQVYDRNLGQLGQWHPSCDWAMVDYRFKNWLGVRAGKVKTTLGLYNDTQDLDFVHTFALLPQSVYPTDLREATIAHWGVDFYGNVSLPRRLGDISYTAYTGYRSDSIYSGYPYLLSEYAAYFHRLGGLQYGGDLRWNTPVKGLLIGASRLDQDTNGAGVALDLVNPAEGLLPYWERSKSDWTNQFYGSFSYRKFRVDSEYRRYLRDQAIYEATATDEDDVRGWYVSGTWHLMRWLSVGSYYSRYTITTVYSGFLSTTLGIPNATDTSQPGNHIFDKVASLRLDPKPFWNVKIEGHFMTGYATGNYPDGFYAQENPQGFQNDTNALVVTTGIHF